MELYAGFSLHSRQIPPYQNHWVPIPLLPSYISEEQNKRCIMRGKSVDGESTFDSRQAESPWV
eukprot:6327569-Amphidinium_carterae.1